MGKKRSQKVAGIPHKEAFQRMSFLYQASMAALTASPSQPSLARFYIHTMKTIGKRLVLRIDPSIKRTVCQSCDSLLVPGVTCRLRMKARRQKHIVVTCLTCGKLKRFLTKADYRLWSQRATEQQSRGEEEEASKTPLAGAAASRQEPAT